MRNEITVSIDSAAIARQLGATLSGSFFDADPPHVGDTVRYTANGVVTAVLKGGTLQITAPLGHDRVRHLGPNDGPISIVKRKAKRPKVGDVCTFDEFKAHMWKHGTIIQGQDGSSAIALTANGDWVNLSAGNTFPFARAYTGSATLFKILHIG